MARLSMNEITTYRWPFEQDIARYAAAGIPAVGVWRQKLSDYGEEKGVELLSESGLAVSNLLWAGGFTGTDGRSYREALEDAEDAIRLAAALRARALIVYSGGRGLHTQNHARRLLVEAIGELVPLAAELEVVLAVEPMHPGCAGEWTFLTNLDETLALVDACDSPQVRIALDTYHLGHDPQLLEWIPRIADRVAVVHLGDACDPPQAEQNRCRLGEGRLPLREIVAALTAAGYDGDYDVELMGEQIETCCYDELLAHSRRAFEELIAG